jgi:hypothetical protein
VAAVRAMEASRAASRAAACTAAAAIVTLPAATASSRTSQVERIRTLTLMSADLTACHCVLCNDTGELDRRTQMTVAKVREYGWQVVMIPGDGHGRFREGQIRRGWVARASRRQAEMTNVPLKANVASDAWLQVVFVALRRRGRSAGVAGVAVRPVRTRDQTPH